MRNKRQKRVKKPRQSVFRRLWRLVERFFDFFGRFFENLSRKWSLSISLKITFAFVAMTWFLVSMLRGFGDMFSFLFTLVGLPLIAIFGNRAVDYLLLPIKDMTTAARDISGLQLNHRLDVREAQDELQDMAITFNLMLDRIETSVSEQKAFISHASHELRTPLSVIDGYANLLDRWGKEEPEVRDEAIQAIKNETSSMKNLIEKLLMISRMDYGTQTVERTEVDVQELIREVVEETMVMEEHTPTFVGNEGTVKAKLDRLMMKELLRILMDNALKYTPVTGTISIKAYDEPSSVQVEIEDTGCGISPVHLPHLFDSFYRADDSRTRRTGGTGLGLAIAKKIVQMHGGEIQVLSELGEGTKFLIVLPKIV